MRILLPKRQEGIANAKVLPRRSVGMKPRVIQSKSKAELKSLLRVVLEEMRAEDPLA